MTFLKIVFVILLCIPVVYIAVWFINDLISQLSEENKRVKKQKMREKRERANRHERSAYTYKSRNSYDKRR